MCILCQHANNREALDQLHCVFCDGCPDIEHVPDLPLLTHLDVGDCPKLKTIGSLPRAINIYCMSCPLLTTVTGGERTDFIHCENSTMITSIPSNERMGTRTSGCYFLYLPRWLSSRRHPCGRGVRDWTQKARNSLMVKRRRALIHRALTEQDSLLNDLARIVLGYVSRVDSFCPTEGI